MASATPQVLRSVLGFVGFWVSTEVASSAGRVWILDDCGCAAQVITLLLHRADMCLWNTVNTGRPAEEDDAVHAIEPLNEVISRMGCGPRVTPYTASTSGMAAWPAHIWQPACRNRGRPQLAFGYEGKPRVGRSTPSSQAESACQHSQRGCEAECTGGYPTVGPPDAVPSCWDLAGSFDICWHPPSSHDGMHCRARGSRRSSRTSSGPWRQ